MKTEDICHIKPVKIKLDLRKPLLGAKLIPYEYSSIFLCARTNSGKSTVINHLLKHTTDERSKIIIFGSTVNIDPLYIKMIADLRKRKIDVLTFEGIISDSGENLLETFLTYISTPEEQEDEKQVIPKPTFLLFDDPENIDKPERKKKKKKYKTRVPKYTIIFDDLTKEELRSDYLGNYLKKSRHYKCRTILSSQNLISIKPTSFSQLYAVYIWKGFSKPYIKVLYERLNINMSFNQFYELYKQITLEKYAFLNIDLRNGDMKRNFDKNLLK
jgi:mRNA-degrading endonuclease RelE of RelBE toxin-antitoxin system